ncbi:MAG: anaerobic ribonucleoside-triphosphate reductase activating protein [archaeon]
MKVSGIQKLSLIDYPDKTATVIFLPGCNFRCGFCHNKDLVEDTLGDLGEDKIFSFLESRKGLVDAVTMTGGEPTIHKELPDFISKIKQLGFLVKLDTNGSNPTMLKQMIDSKLVDYVAMDIKAPLQEYHKTTNIPIDKDKINKSVEFLKKGKVDYEFRTTLVPGLIDKASLMFIAKWLKGSKKYVLQQFRPKDCMDPDFNKKRPFKRQHIFDFQKAMQPHFKIVEVRNLE